MHQCFTALSSLDCGDLHLLTLSWGKAPQTKAQCPESLHAALAFLGRKILAELASRAAFAAPRRTEEGAALFRRCGMIRVTHQLYRLEMPLAAARAHTLHIESSPGPSGLLWPLSVKERLADYSRRVAGDTCLTRWLEGFIKQHLASFGSNAPFCLEPAASKLSHAFGSAFGRQLGWDFVRNVCSFFGQGIWTPPFISVFGREFGCNFSQSFVQDFGRKYVRIFLRMFVRIHYLITARFSFADFTRLFFRNILPAISCDFGGDFAHDLSHNLGNHGAALYRAVGVDPHHTDWQARWDMAMDQARNAPSTQVANYWSPPLSGLGEIEADVEAEGSKLAASLGNPLSLPSMMADLWSAGIFNYLFALGRHLAAAGPSDQQIIMAALDWLPRNPFEVFNVGLAWEEHAIEYTAAVGRLSGPSGALFLAHAAYTALMTGLVGGQRSQPTWEQLVKERDQDDWLVRFSHLLYELCRFRETARVELDMNTLLATCPREFYAVLEAAGFLKNGCPIVRFG